MGEDIYIYMRDDWLLLHIYGVGSVALGSVNVYCSVVCGSGFHERKNKG
jgi:hypothetical protein